MIFSKANLVGVDIAKADKGIPALDNLHLRADGTTVTANGSTVLAISPANDAKVPLENTRMIGAETVSSETVREVLKGMPRDTLFGGTLEHCDYSGGRFTLTDGKRHRNISARTYPREYIDYEKIFKRVGAASTTYKTAINLRRLVDLLGCIDRMFPDTGKNTAVYLSFTSENDVVVRGVGVDGRQRCLGIIKSYSGAEGTWLTETEWEKQMMGVGAVEDTVTILTNEKNESPRKIGKKKRVA